MSLSAQVLDALVQSGLTAEQLANVIKADMAAEQEKAARQIPWAKLRQMAFERDGDCCGYCGTTEGPFEIDHITPRAAGGENVLENVVVACQSCNRAKRDRQGEEWRVLSERRAKDRERKRQERAEKKGQSAPVRVVHGRSKDNLPNEYISNPSGFDVSNETSAVPSFPDRVVEAWNGGIAGTPLPAARKLIGSRLKHLRARAKEHGEEAVFEAMRNMIASDWHSGSSGKWLEGCLGWLLKSGENFEKMLERTNSQASPSSPSNLASLIQQGKRFTPKDQAA